MNSLQTKFDKCCHSFCRAFYLDIPRENETKKKSEIIKTEQKKQILINNLKEKIKKKKMKQKKTIIMTIITIRLNI